jgi:hypothetical protein
MATGRIPTTANSPLTVKGDLFGYSTTQARVPVGNDGETLVADSSTTTGLRYQGSTAAGRNFAINGGFDIWQRGTSTTSTPAAYTCADRFATWISSGTGTIERVTANIPDTFSYGIKYTSSGAGGRGRLYHAIETLDAQKLAGQTVTLSFYVSGTVGKTFIATLSQSATVDNSFTGSYTSIGSQTVTLTGTSTRYQATYTIPTTAKTILIQLANVSTDLFANTENYTLTGVQLEVGSIATEFSRAGGTIQGELAACQRYYEVVYPSGTAYSGVAVVTYSGATTGRGHPSYFKVPKRTTSPTITITGTYEIIGVGTVTIGTSGEGAITANYGIIDVVTSGRTVGYSGYLRNSNDTTATITASAEL